jgi:DNA recombination protein RmuC
MQTSVQRFSVVSIVAFIGLVLIVVALVLLVLVHRKVSQTTSAVLESRIDGFEKTQERTERVVKEEIALSRGELSKAAGEQRQELSSAFKTFGDSVAQRINYVAGLQKTQLESFSAELRKFIAECGARLDTGRAESASAAKQLRDEVGAALDRISGAIRQTMGELASVQRSQLDSFATQLTSFAKASGERLDTARTDSANSSTQLRQEVVNTLTGISDSMTRTIKELGDGQNLQLDRVSNQIESLTTTVADKLENVRATVDAELKSMKSENVAQLEQMRQTVDEKLQGTLEKRLGESFKQVSERLEEVHKGLGEMQSLATGVGDLKKVLTNVSIRGTWGEKQLGALLEQVLSPDQFAKNVSTKGNSERVEFAVKLPGQGADKGEVVWLPIDAKFPRDDYERLIDAQQRADKEEMDVAGKALENRILSCARDISEKYFAPPNTTDFGILFLPVEGLFAETIRRTALIDKIQQNYRVVVAGPTTLWSILNSLQMGFRTLAIQKRSSEVWNLLAGVKTEWTKYGKVLDAVQKKLHQASETIEDVRVRSRAIGRKLRDVQELPVSEATALLPEKLSEEDAEPAEELEHEDMVA